MTFTGTLMRMSAKDWRVIAEYAQLHDLKPKMSTPSSGQYFFTTRQGVEVKVGITTMTKEIEEARKGDKRS